MKTLISYLKPYDYIVCLSFLALSFLPIILSWFFFQNQASTSLQAVVKIDGQQVDQFKLAEGAGHREERYQIQAGQYSIVEQIDDQIRVKADNSPQQIAVKKGWISQPGEIIVNLAHQLVIEIKGTSDEEIEDDLILPHGG